MQRNIYDVQPSLPQERRLTDKGRLLFLSHANYNKHYYYKINPEIEKEELVCKRSQRKVVVVTWPSPIR